MCTNDESVQYGKSATSASITLLRESDDYHTSTTAPTPPEYVLRNDFILRHRMPDLRPEVSPIPKT